MQPITYLTSSVGMIWVILCIPLGFALTAFGYFIINRIPAKWLCDYNETPSEELLSGKRVRFLPSGILSSVVLAACLVLCRLQFNKGFDIYFCVLTLILLDCLLIAVADLKYQIIPDQFTIILGVLAAAISVYDLVRGYHIFHSAWWSPLAGAGIGAAAMMIIDLIGMLVYKRDGMGFGDVKLFFAVGILTGFPGTIYTFIISIITATVFFVAIIIISKIIHSRSASVGETEAEKDTAANGQTEVSETEDAKQEEASEAVSVPEIQEDNAEDKEEEESESSEADDDNVGFGSYLAFGPYIAAATAVYIALFDLVNFLVRLYLDLF